VNVRGGAENWDVFGVLVAFGRPEILLDRIFFLRNGGEVPMRKDAIRIELREWHVGLFYSGEQTAGKAAAG